VNGELPFKTPLPLAVPGAPHPAFDPVVINLAFRQLNALMRMRGVGDLNVLPAESGFVVEQKEAATT